MLILLIHFKKLKSVFFSTNDTIFHIHISAMHNFEQILEQIFSHKNIIHFQEILYW